MTHVKRHRPSSPASPGVDPQRRPPADVGMVVAVGDVAVGKSVHAALVSLSHHVALVTSATEALREIALLRPALRVIDDELPLVRGLDLAGRVRSERSDVEIILMTDDDLAASVIDRLRVERIRCLMKPIDLEKLRQAVGVSSRALASRADSEYDDLAAELSDQKSRFERRIKNLERKSDSSIPPPRMPVEQDAPPTERVGTLPDDLRVLV